MAATTNSAKVTLPTDEQILITREFDAPRELVYRAYTEPDLVRRWWAGKRGAMTVAEIDLRVGGSYRYVMVADGGHEVAFHGEFRELVAGERVVHTEVYEAAPPGTGPALVTVTLTGADARTTMTMLMELESREVRDAILESGMEGGLQESLDLLEVAASALG